MKLIGPPNYSSKLGSNALDELVPHSFSVGWTIRLFAVRTRVAWIVFIKLVDFVSRLTLTLLLSYAAMGCQPTVPGRSFLWTEILRYTCRWETLPQEARHLWTSAFLTLCGRFLKAMQVLYQQLHVPHLSRRANSLQKHMKQHLNKPTKTPVNLWKILVSPRKKQVRN